MEQFRDSNGWVFHRPPSDGVDLLTAVLVSEPHLDLSVTQTLCYMELARWGKSSYWKTEG